MKFEIKQDVLIEHLNYVIRGISSKNLRPILNCIKFELTNEGLYLMSTDNEIAIKTFIDKKDIEKIMKEIERLTIKRRFLKNIEKFLYDDDQERVISFCGKAGQFNEEKEEKEEIDFLSLYKIFLKYNIS